MEWYGADTRYVPVAIVKDGRLTFVLRPQGKHSKPFSGEGDGFPKSDVHEFLDNHGLSDEKISQESIPHLER